MLSYVWPSGETRDFVLTQDMFFVESSKHESWFPAYQFLRPLGSSRYIIDLPTGCIADVPGTTLWLPQSFNYTHFILDFIGPWSEFLHMVPEFSDARLILRAPWKSWQEPLLHQFPGKSHPLLNLSPGSLQVLRLSKLIIPISPSPAKTLFNTRNLFSNWYPFSPSTPSGYPVIYLKRSSSEAKRVLNCTQISAYIEQIGGLSLEAASLSFQQKATIFGSAKIIVAEGSGVANALLFGRNYILIVLASPEMYTDSSFLLGGWLYSALAGGSLRIVRSNERSSSVKRGGLGCYSFDISRIRQIIDQELAR